ncbi:malto-oligosyltrehalose synthase [Solirubrobacter phytolaccae]|uniref:Malto-oligosyltrehalose synthase n=1 Tax=Solirubrobacter phytolaccae TaxID=1404360 RepID=A0A9X3SE40_9ACTN|nr:malto-oligosyltrehalose synthase [Solirubrobacter phytolaccae]MDA0184490.1 malto-oligosyltrehalose synthase [Solirubrobacter phytolaccae]
MSDLRATYRLQLGGDFGFAAARELVPYLADLGVSHLYLPPSFQAREGSTHGYDVVDPGSISNELGGEDEFLELVAVAREAGLGIVLDIVPNHMATDEKNRYWSDPELRRKFFDLDEKTGRHRRFFDIDHLAGVRQEDPEVFAETHKLALRLVNEGIVDGLRIDHPDGLADPAGYLQRLRDGGAEHVWVEKILDPGEPLRDWAIDGTVGYEFLNDVAALFVDPAGEAPLTDLWVEVSGDDRRFGELAFEAKLEQARTAFAPEVERLLREAPERVAGLERALASFPVYRTYVEPWSGKVADEDRHAVAEAGLPASLASKLLLEVPGWEAFITRFQQTTPPVMAKGVEDTAFYRYARLLALNDVGGDPGRFSVSVRDFHRGNAERAERFPNNLLVTQTHDTKRSGDVRARIGTLASMPEEYAAHVRTWLSVCRSLTSGGAPTPVEQLFIFQTLLGAWPISEDRLHGYLEKAMREAKQHTTWVDVNEEHEGAVQSFARALLTHRDFLRTFLPFQEQVAAAGEQSALGQLALKLTVPGVPDIYQGDELLCLSLVDPDNRRAVDWDERRAALASAAPPAKLQVIRTLLALRKRLPEAFAGAYAAVEAGEDVVAFTRGEDQVFVAVRLRGQGELPRPEGEWAAELELDGLLVLSRR